MKLNVETLVSHDPRRGWKEGWSLTLVMGATSVSVCLEAYDSNQTTEEVFDFVLTQAMMVRSDYHLGALKILHGLNPEQFAEVEGYAASIGYGSVTAEFARLKPSIAA